MAKKPDVTKIQAVRGYLKDHPGAMSGEIAVALTKQGVTINPGHVANIKTKINKEAATKKAAKKPAAVAAPALAAVEKLAGFSAGVAGAVDIAFWPAAVGV